MKLLSELYKVTLKKSIRGKASEGFIRPTIGQSFMSHKDFIEVVNYRFMPETLGFLDVIEHPHWDGGWWKKHTVKESVNVLSDGKWYLEQNVLYIFDPTSMYIEIVNADDGTRLAIDGGYTRSSGYSLLLHTGDVMGLAIDVDNRRADFYENGVLKNTLIWPEYHPLKLKTALQNHGTGDSVDPRMGKIQINVGPDFSFPVPEGYKAFIDL